MKNLFKHQLTLFILLLLLWNLFMPVFEGADEMGHYCSADYIAHKNKLPNVLIKDGCFIWHPPLYYALLSPLLKVFSLPQFDPSTVEINPKAELLRKGEYAQYIHSKQEFLFVWNPIQISVHLLRLITSLTAVLMFIITWKISSGVFAKSIIPNLSLILFFNPMFLHIFSTITNVTLISLISTLVIAIDIRQTNKSNKWDFVQGIILGLGFITKITAVLLIPAYLIITLLNYKRGKYPFKKLIAKLSVFSLGFFLSAGWYIGRNLLIYGQIIEASAQSNAFGKVHHDLLLEQVGPLNYINSIFLSLFKTFWSSYGMLTIRFPEIVNVFLLIVSLFVVYSLFVKRGNFNRELKIAVIYALSIFGGLIIMNFRLAAMHAKDLFPAYMPFALLFGYGLFQAKSVVYTVNSKIFTTIGLIFGSYLFAQVEIVKLAKSLFQLQWNQTAFLFLAIVVKTVLVFALIKIVVSLIGKAKFDPKNVVVLTYLIASVDLVILSSSVYLLYKSFI